MIAEFLANVPADAISPAAVGTIIGGVIAALLGGGFLGKKIGETRTTVVNQPLDVRLRQEFLTRAEHDVYRAEVKADFVRMEASILRSNERVDEKHMELLMTIERAARTGLDGRVALWNELKPLSNELAALKATSNVADQLAKLANVLEKKTDAKTPRN